MSAHSEEILHQSVHRHEPLHMGGGFEASHLSLAPPALNYYEEFVQIPGVAHPAPASPQGRAHCGPNVRHQRRIISWVTVTPR